jgi:hypothetical protein
MDLRRVTLPFRLILALSAGALALGAVACGEKKLGEARMRLDPTNWEMALIEYPFDSGADIVSQANLLDGPFPADVGGTVELAFDGTDLAWTVDSDIGTAAITWPFFAKTVFWVNLGVVGGDGPAWFGNFTLDGDPIPADLTSPDANTWVIEPLECKSFLLGRPWSIEGEFSFANAPGPAQEKPKVFIELMKHAVDLPDP